MGGPLFSTAAFVWQWQPLGCLMPLRPEKTLRPTLLAVQTSKISVPHSGPYWSVPTKKDRGQGYRCFSMCLGLQSFFRGGEGGGLDMLISEIFVNHYMHARNATIFATTLPCFANLFQAPSCDDQALRHVVLPNYERS